MMTTVTTDKPFHIEKKRVYEAYKAVRSNRGAAGVDGQTLEQFDECYSACKIDPHMRGIGVQN